MTFNDFTYSRPEMEVFTKQFKDLLAQFAKATSFEDQSSAFEQINDLRTEFTSMYNICHVRHTIDTKDEFR